MEDKEKKDRAVAAFSMLYNGAGRACDNFLFLMDTDGDNAALALSRLREDWPARVLEIEPNIGEREERQQLFSVLLSLYGHDYRPTINAICLAVFLVAPIENLRLLIHDAKSSTTSLVGVVFLGGEMLDVTRTFLTKKKKEAKNVSAASSLVGTPRTPAVKVPSASKISSSPLAQPPMTGDNFSEGHSGEKRKASSPASGSPGAKKMATIYTAPTTPPAAPSTPPGPAVDSPMRKRSAIEATYRRDGNTCILTGNPRPDGAHIFPFSGTKDRAAMIDTFNVLRAFWGPERVEKLKAQCEDSGITESPKNMLSLSKTMHGLWGNCAFGLKPLSSTHNEVLLQFHWLHQGPMRPRDSVSSANLDNMVRDMVGGRPNGFAESHVDDENVRGRNDTISHRLSGQRLETGQVFAVKADKEEDLPSMELLQLQWDLVRVCAMCGAAGVFDEATGDSDEGGFLWTATQDSDFDSLIDSDDGEGGLLRTAAKDSDVDSLILDNPASEDDEDKMGDAF